VLASIGGKETKGNQPILDKSTIRDLVIRHRDHAGCSASTKPVESKKSLLLTSMAVRSSMVNTFKDTINGASSH
jgi:hypothetical protein